LECAPEPDMISTYLSYNLVAKDLKAEMNRVSEQTLVSREAAYFKANIGKVRSAEEFVDDYRLYSFAMKAHGLEDMIYARAFMLKVLESDLSDNDSYANRLTDKRYRDFAAAFQFEAGSKVPMSVRQVDEAIGLYDESIASLDDQISAETGYYKAMAGSIENVDQFLANPRLFDYMAQSYGIDASTVDRTFLRGILASDPDDPASFLNTNLVANRTAAETALSTSQPLLNDILARQSELDDKSYMVAFGEGIASIQDAINEAVARQSEPAADVGAIQIEIDVLTDALHTSFRNFIELAMVDLREEEASLIANGMEASPEMTALRGKIDAWNADTGARWTISSALNDITELEASKSEEGADLVSIQSQIDLLRTSISDAEASLTVTTADIDDAVAAKDAAILSYTGLPELGAPTDELYAQLTSDIAQGRTYLDKTEKYIALAYAYNFNNDGTVAVGGFQSEAEIEATTELYITSQDRLTLTGAMLNDEYFREQIAAFSTVDEMMADARIVSYLKSAFNLDTYLTVVTSTLTNAITTPASEADLEDPTNYLVAFHKGKPYFDDLVALSRAFNFQEDGTLPDGALPVDTENQSILSSRYFSGYDDADEEADREAIRRLRLDLLGLNTADATINDLFASSAVYNFAMKASGFDVNEVPQRIMRKVLTSDLQDPRSFVYSLKDERYVKFARLFNFDSEGKAAAPLSAQDQGQMQQISRDYIIQKSRFLSGDEATKARTDAEAEASYYQRTLADIQTLDELLSNRRLVDFALTSKGVDPKTVSTAELNLLFRSDLNDPESYANTVKDIRLSEVVAAFNFDASGKIAPRDADSISSRGDLYETMNLYLRQTIEQDRGEENNGVRLALYFERMAPTITSAYDILGDTALYETFKTIFSLPDEISGMDVDAQAALIESRLDLADLADPEKLSKLVERFTIMYDLASGNNNPSAAELILGGSSSASISFDMLLSLSQLGR
jgi:hypothetical protein